MNKRKLLATTTIVFAFLSSSALCGEFVPLKGKFEGVGAEFGGKFTHLGKFEGLVTSSDGAGNSTAVWTAANGDTVTNAAVFVLGPPVPGAPAGVFFYTQTIVITGGTGRFANATGFADVVGTIDFSDFSYDGVLNGEISRPSKK